jgi:hypothetical protein
MGEHHGSISHDQINRFMRVKKLRPRHLWQAVRGDVVASKKGFLLFDDTTLNKEYSEKIEMAQRQYSGAEHSVVMGINVVNCVYYNPETNQFWVIDYRVYNPIADGKNKLEHVEDMLKHTIEWKKLDFMSVLFDTWYATNDLMEVVDSLDKFFYCPIKKNRLMTQGMGWTTAEHLDWNEETLQKGQRIRLKGQAKTVNICLHRMEKPTRSKDEAFEYIATNDTTNFSQAVADTVGFRWKVEEYHREVKQLTGIERCQCRKARAQRNHIVCAMLAWVVLKRAAYARKITPYQLKLQLLFDYMVQTLSLPLEKVMRITRAA